MNLPLIGGGAGIPFHAPFRTHKLDDAVVQASLGQHLVENVGWGWYAWVCFSDGRGLALGHTAGTRKPDAEVCNLLQQTAILLNATLAEDGHWIVAYNLENEPVVLWRDHGGDIHVCFEIGVPGVALLSWRPSDIFTLAHEALMTYRAQVAPLELKPSEQIFKALGQKATPTRH
jgi:hypothetical protein